MKRQMRTCVCVCVLSAGLLSACTPLYLTPVPERPQPTPRLDLKYSEGLIQTQNTLQLRLNLASIPAEGWLAVQWFAPNNQEVASDSYWLTLEEQGLVKTLYLPDDITLTSGDWRAVLSFDGQVARQFSITIP